jgi:ATPase subunit of ABC transporter with duplicated ATPase domains
MLDIPIVEKKSTFLNATAGNIGPSSPEVSANDSIRDGLSAKEKQSPATETQNKSNFSGSLLKSVLPNFIYATLSNDSL